MKKYICPNCGFRSWRGTKKKGRERKCLNCSCQVYRSKTVLESMMKIDILKQIKNLRNKERNCDE